MRRNAPSELHQLLPTPTARDKRASPSKPTAALAISQLSCRKKWRKAWSGLQYDPFMLAAILPGIRHVRTPLVVGSLYFLAFWMAFGPENLHFSLDGKSTAEKRAAALFDGLPTTLTWSACAVAAVIVGSRATFTFWDRLKNDQTILPKGFDAEIQRRVSAYRLTVKQVNASLLFNPSPFVREPDPYVSPEELEQRRRFPESAPELKPFRDDGGDGLVHFYSEYSNVEGWMLWRELKTAILDEADVLLTRLKVERESVFNDIDRERSEAELRFSIVPPLIVLVGALAFTWHWTLVFAVLPLVAMAHQAYKIELSARKEIFVALQHGVIESPTLETLAALGGPISGISDADLIADLREEFEEGDMLLSWLTNEFNAQHILPEYWVAFETAVERWRPLESEFRDPAIGADFRRFVRRLSRLHGTIKARHFYVDRTGDQIGQEPYYQGDRAIGYGVLVESQRQSVVNAYEALMKAADERGL